MVTLVVTRHQTTEPVVSTAKVDRQPREEKRKFPGVFHNEARQRWEQRISIDGKRMMFTAKTPAAVAAKVAAAKDRHAKGLAPGDANLTVKAYLAWWLTEILPSTVSASTTRNYRDVLTFYVIPHIGTKQLSTLKPGDVTAMLNKLERAGAAPNTRRAARSVLRRALRRAEQEGIISRNVAAVVYLQLQKAGG